MYYVEHKNEKAIREVKLGDQVVEFQLKNVTFSLCKSTMED